MTWTSLARRSLLAAFIVAAGLAFLPGFFAYQLTKRRAAIAPEDPRHAPVSVTPLRLTTRDGLELGAWYLPASPDAARAVVLVHGNGGQRSTEGPMLDLLHRLDCHVLAVTVRAHGDSGGDSNDFGYSARHDVVAAFEALGRHAPNVPRFILGRSLGAAAALFAAADLEDHPAGLALESPYATLEIATKNRLRMMVPRPLVKPAYLGLAMWAGWFLPVSIDEIAPERAAKNVPPQVPVVLLAGARDRHATLAEMRRIQTALPGGAQLVVFERAAHAEPLITDRERYRAALIRLFETHSPR